MRLSALSTVALLTMAAALLDPTAAHLGPDNYEARQNSLAQRRAFDATQQSTRMEFARSKVPERDSVRKHYTSYTANYKPSRNMKKPSPKLKKKTKAKASAKAKAKTTASTKGKAKAEVKTKAKATSAAVKPVKAAAVVAPASAAASDPAPSPADAAPASAPAANMRPAVGFLPFLNNFMPPATPSSTSPDSAAPTNIVPVKPGSTEMTSGPRSDRNIIYQTVPLTNNIKMNTVQNSGRVLVAAKAPGVKNVMGRGQDPAPLSRTVNGQEVYYFPDVDFGHNVFIRSSADLSEVQRAAPKKVFSYGTRIGTEAADLAEWVDGKFILTVSSTRYDTMYSLVSKTNDPLGEWEDLGEIMGADGQPLEGYDSHVFAHPNGKRYITWSDHHSIIMAELASANKVVGNQVPVAYFPTPAKQNWFDHREFFNTEAPSTVVLPNQNGSSTLNLLFANGNFERSDYHTRLMYIDTKLDPLVPTNWVLAEQSILETKADVNVYGPGSGGFFQRNGQTWFAYGAWPYSDGQGAAWSGRQRTIRAQQVAVNTDGIVRPMEPVATALDS